MRWLKQCFGFLVIMTWMVASAPLHASPIVWQLVGVTFTDGAIASGAFTYDAALDLYSAWNMIVTPGILTAYDYRPGVDGGFLGIHPAGQVDFVAFPPATSGRYVRLTFSSPLTGAGGTDLLRTDNSGYECDNCSIHRYITGGAVASVPEPSNLTMVPVALAIAALLRRVRLRSNAQHTTPTPAAEIRFRVERPQKRTPHWSAGTRKKIPASGDSTSAISRKIPPCIRIVGRVD